MWISYLGVFICVLSAYDVYEEKNAVLFTSPTMLLSFLFDYIRTWTADLLKLNNQRILLNKTKEHKNR